MIDVKFGRTGEVANEMEVTNRTTIAGLLRTVKVEVRPWEYVSVNGKEIRKADFEKWPLNEGDRVIVVQKTHLPAKIQRFFGRLAGIE